MSAAMIAVPTVPAYAAQNDVIDTTRTASLTIHKYDMTAAKKGGVNLDQFTSTGKQDAAAEEALKNYAIKGVEFSYYSKKIIDAKTRVFRSNQKK